MFKSYKNSKNHVPFTVIIRCLFLCRYRETTYLSQILYSAIQSSSLLLPYRPLSLEASVVTMASVPSGSSASLRSLCRSQTWRFLLSPATSRPLLCTQVTTSAWERFVPELLGLMPPSSADHEVTQLGQRVGLGSAKSAHTLTGGRARSENLSK